MPNLSELVEYCAEMSRRKFTDATVLGTGAHLRRESDELNSALTNGGHILDAMEEVADIFVLASQQWRFFQDKYPEYGGVHWLEAAFKAKIQKVERRQYGKPDADGVIEHIKGRLSTHLKTHPGVNAFCEKCGEQIDHEGVMFQIKPGETPRFLCKKHKPAAETMGEPANIGGLPQIYWGQGCFICGTAVGVTGMRGNRANGELDVFACYDHRQELYDELDNRQ